MPKYPDNKKSVGAAASTGKKGGSKGAVTKANNKASVNAAIAAPGKAGGSVKGIGARYEKAAMKDAARPSKKGHKAPAGNGAGSGIPVKSFKKADSDPGHGKKKGNLHPPSM